jgi:hypothetical protein
MLSLNCKHVQLVKIYMPCNFEVNLITRLGVIALFSSFFSSPDPKGHVYEKVNGWTTDNGNTSHGPLGQVS